jgi:uncharacterized protein YfaS (alpha-2-macroglobulin family)
VSASHKSYGPADLAGTLERQCELYTDRQSYRAGDTVQIHLSTAVRAADHGTAA